MITNRTSVVMMSIVILGSSLCTNSSDARIHIQGSVDYGNPDGSMEQVGKVGLVVGAVGLATYGLVKLGGWLFNKSDETATEQAQKAVREASAQYSSITTILGHAYSDSIDPKECINNISEPVLYEIAKAKYHDADIAVYLRQFGSTIKNIEKQAKNLRNRINSAQSLPDQDYETLRLIARMKAIEIQIQSLLPSLTFAYDYLNHHESFFTLFETEDSMMYRYERDLHAVDSYQGDMSYLREMIHQSVMLYQRRHSDPYPYRWYLKRLEEDIHVMHRAMNKIAYEYTNRYNVANALCNKLEFIRETLIGSPYYSDELRAYEYAKIAQAAIDAQQRQAHAQEQQARELQRHNDLQAKELDKLTRHDKDHAHKDDDWI